MKKGHSAGRALWITPHRDSTKIYTMNGCLSSGKSARGWAGSGEDEAVMEKGYQGIRGLGFGYWGTRRLGKNADV
jgi:hypothetical protein